MDGRYTVNGSCAERDFLDKEVKMNKSDDEDDNFDAIHESGGKLPILRPILKAEIYKPLQNLARKHVIPIVKDVILSLSPPQAEEEIEGESQNVKNDDIPDWVHELMGGRAYRKRRGPSRSRDSGASYSR